MRRVSFPSPVGTNVNMLPIVMGDARTVPVGVRQYLPMIESCDLRRGSTVYLSVSESHVSGTSQRRGGVHTEGTSALGWGGGGWGSSGPGLGVYMASTDGACRLWSTEVMTASRHGAVATPAMAPTRMLPGTLYKMSDRTPHEALTSDGYRQWFRLVGDAIGGWWERHSTRNPMVPPHAPVLIGSKFGDHHG